MKTLQSKKSSILSTQKLTKTTTVDAKKIACHSKRSHILRDNMYRV